VHLLNCTVTTLHGVRDVRVIVIELNCPELLREPHEQHALNLPKYTT